MKPRQLNVCFATFPYGGTGGTASEVPTVRDWLLTTMLKARNDPRISAVDLGEYCDTPITMTRNRAVLEARQRGVDVLVMIDSDMAPDLYPENPPHVVPFWDAAFNFLYDHYDKGPVCVAAPYGGPPPHENVYIFRWRNQQSEHPDIDVRLAQYTREEGFDMIGIHEAAALPTGLSMFDMRIFELTEPKPNDFRERLQELLGPLDGLALTPEGIERLAAAIAEEKYTSEHSWFYYEWTNLFQAEKASTEDVTATRDLSLAGISKLGYNPIFCAWSSWAGHWKPKCVGKPQLLTADDVAEKMARAVTEGRQKDAKLMDVGQLRKRQ